MKLYTEEQVKEILSDFIGAGHANDYLQKYYPPIELPSDEEIATKIENMEGISLEIEVGYRAGARWMRNKLLNK